MKEFEKIDYLPLGSIVILKGGVQKIVINARGVVHKVAKPPVYFDYGGSIYPQGIIDDKILYFNHADIVKVIFEGYHDEDDKMMVYNINESFANSGLERKDLSVLMRRGKE